MTIKIISVNKNNFIEWRKSIRRVFGDIPKDEDVKRLARDRMMNPISEWKSNNNRLIAAIDEDTERIVGTGGADKLEITIPGGKPMDMAGIAYMGTAPTHKRKGIFSSMMRKLHDQAKDRGDALAGLWASQSLLYSRFGYGLATYREDWEIYSHNTKINKKASDDIKLEFVDKDKALIEIPKIYDQFRKNQNGFTDKSEGYWKYLLHEDEKSKYNKSGMSGFFFVICYKNEKPSGYIFYNIKKESGVAHEDDKGELIVQEQIALDTDSNIALWNFIFGVELIEKVYINRRAPSDPLYFLLENPRKLERNTIDGLWVRIIDIKKLLESREYNYKGKIIIELTGQNQPDIEGIYELETDGKISEVKKVKSKPDVIMRPSDLSSCYFGAVSAYELFQAGNIEFNRNNLIKDFSNMFSVTKKPWCNTDF